MRFSLLGVAILFALLTSCNKEEGCRDSDALNFNASAEKDGPCTYTKVIFHAPGDKVGGNGNRITKIEIFRGPTPGEQLIGEITQFNQGSVITCNPPDGSFVYELPGGGVEYLFLTRYYYENNTNEAGDSYNRSVDSSTECYIIQLTL